MHKNSETQNTHIIGKYSCCGLVLSRQKNQKFDMPIYAIGVSQSFFCPIEKELIKKSRDFLISSFLAMQEKSVQYL